VKETRRQETVEEGVRCFRCGKKGYKKWECLQMKERKREMMALLHKVWKKVKEHYEAKEFPPREVRMSMEGWTMKWEVVTLIECRGCDYKGDEDSEEQRARFPK